MSFELIYNRNQVFPRINLMPDTHITVSTFVDLTYIERLLNAEVPNSFSKAIDKKTKIKKMGLKTSVKYTLEINANLTDRIQIQTVNDALRVELPLDIKVRVSCSKLGNVRTTLSSSLLVSITTSLSVSEEWEPNIQTELKYQWASKPEIKLFKSIKVRLTSIIEPEIGKALKSVQPRVKKLIEELDLKSKLETVWQETHKPKLIVDKPATWLVTQPKAFKFSGIRYNNESLELVTQMDCNLAIFITEDTPKTQVPIAIPKLKPLTYSFLE
ncbi:DUF4403 family protein [Vibrio breoganii]